MALAQTYAGEGEAAAASFDALLLAGTQASTPAEAIRSCGDGDLLTDAAAAFYTNARYQNLNERYSEALAAANRALTVNSRNSRALFTRALVFERLELRDDAHADWLAYLGIDDVSPWAAEARGHLRALQKPSVGQSLPTTATILQRLGTMWAPSRDQAVLNDLHAAASAIERTSGDSLARETVEFVQTSPTTDVALAFANYARAAADYKIRHISVAEPALDTAIEAFQGAACPALYAALVQKGGCRFYDNDVGGALRLATDVAQRAPGRYRGALGQALWLAGLSNIILGRSRNALQAYDDAASEFRAIHDADNLSAVETLLAELYEYLGDPDKALARRRAALRDAYASGNAFRVAMALSEMGEAAQSKGDSEEAAVVFRRLVAVSRDAHDPLVEIDARMSYGRLLASTGNSSEATTLFHDAFEIAAREQDSAVRERIESTITLRAAEADLATATTPAQLDAAIAFFSRTGNRFSLASALLVRGNAASRRGQARAAADFRRAISLITAEIHTIRDPIVCAQYLEHRQAFYDALVATLVERQEIEAAFLAADEAHETLLATYRAEAMRSFAQVTVPRDTAIVELFVTNHQVYSWLLTGGRVEGARIAASTPALQQLVKSTMTATHDGREADARALLRRLDGLLLEPWAARFGGVSRLIIVPDQFLAGVPFPALVAPDGRHRIEEFEIGTAVSAAHYLVQPDRRMSTAADVGILALNDDFGDFLPNLPEVTRELNRLREVYPGADILRDVRSPTDLIAFIGRHAIAHIATHGFANSRRPLSSGIHLHGASSLTAEEIATSHFDSTALVFLATCESSAAVPRRTAVGNITTAFLAAGVPTVIGTLWDVADDDAQAMAVAFHRELRRGLTPLAALRAAQQTIRSHAATDNQSLSWAAYVLVGTRVNEERRKIWQQRPSS